MSLPLIAEGQLEPGPSENSANRSPAERATNAQKTGLDSRAPSFGDESVNDGRIVAITKVTSVHTRNDLIQDTPTEAPIAFDEIFTNAMLG